MCSAIPMTLCWESYPQQYGKQEAIETVPEMHISNGESSSSEYILESTASVCLELWSNLILELLLQN